MRRLGLMEAGPTAPGRAEDAIGLEIRHAGMVVQRADLLVAGLTGNAVAQDQGVSGPGPPLFWLVGSAEENHRQRAGRRGQVGRPGIGADEQVGPFQQGRGLSDREPAGPVAQPLVTSKHLGRGRVFRPAHDDHAPAILQESLDERVPVPGGPALGRRAGTKMDRQKRGMRAEPTCVQPLGIGGPRPTLGGGESRLAAIVRTAPPAGTDWDLEPSRCFPGPGPGQAASHGCPVLIIDMDLDPRRFVASNAQRVQQRQARANLVTAANPVRDVSEQELATAHGPSHPPRNSPQGQDQNRQHIAPDVDSKVVLFAADRPTQPPDLAEQAPAAGCRSNQVRSAIRTWFTPGSASNTS